MNNRKGSALVFAALLCMVLVPMIGMGIDSATSYMLREEISGAVDAAALAGARSLNVGQDIPSQTANATTVAQNVFNADLPSAHWNMANITSTVNVAQNNVTHFRSVTVTAGGDFPLLFMGMLGASSAHIGLTATAQRRDVNVVLVLDHSGSMSAAMPAMLTEATNFVNMFAGGRDNLGLVVFTGSTFVAFHPSTTFKSASPNVATIIGQLTSNNGATNTSQAMSQAYNELKNLNQPGALNVIVLFTDGLANTYTADFAPYVSKGASGCTGLANPLAGVVLAYSNGSGISGLSDPTATSLNDVTESRAAPNSGGCFWSGNPLAETAALETALTGLPATDINGNSTDGHGTIGAYLPVNRTLAGLSSDAVAAANVTNSGMNAFDDAASRIRSDATFTPLIYAIGLGGSPGSPPDNVLMARVANDPSSPSYNKNQAAGLYVFSPTTQQLHSAFLRIASEILRLSK